MSREEIIFPVFLMCGIMCMMLITNNVYFICSLDKERQNEK